MNRIEFDRRAFTLGAIAVAGTAALGAAGAHAQVGTQTHLVIDLAGEPNTLDPALARSYRDWSLVHSIYDSVVTLGNDGEMRPLAADSVTLLDDVTWEIVLRKGMTFHDGTPVTSAAIQRGVERVANSEGPAANSFKVIESVDIVDDLTARFTTSTPAPWLLSQLAVWLVLMPELPADHDYEAEPIGSGPFRFNQREPGKSISLVRFDEHFAGSPKGEPVAASVEYRFVPDAVTRIADLAAGTVQIIDQVETDQRDVVTEGGGTVIEAPVLGTAFLRVVNDVEPFTDPRVTQAINHAIDVQSIASALVSPNASRLASLFPDDRAIGFDPELAPFAFDPDRARALLSEAGLADGFATTLQFTSGSRTDLMEAIAANLAEVGIDLTLEPIELAQFNGSWKEPDSAPLRFVTWRPMYDPYTLLSLMFSSEGFLSRYSDTEADSLIQDAAIETDPAARQEVYRELGRHFQEVPPAVFLWGLSALYGVRDLGSSWAPRSDEYLLPLSQPEGVQA